MDTVSTQDVVDGLDEVEQDQNTLQPWGQLYPLGALGEQEQIDEELFLRTVERLVKSSGRKRHVIGRENKQELGWRQYIVDETKWPGPPTCTHPLSPETLIF
jgi:hypothetical protein